MFTGIIEELGTVLESGEGRLRVRAPLVTGDAAPGDSIAVNGVDLTVAALEGVPSPPTSCRRRTGARRWATCARATA